MTTLGVEEELMILDAETHAQVAAVDRIIAGVEGLDLPGRLRDGFLSSAQVLAGAVVEGLGAEGSFVAMNNVVSQSVPHLHLHVVPRTKGDGLRGFFWPRTRYADGEAPAYAARLRAAIG